MSDQLTRTVEALLFLSPEPVGERELVAATGAEPEEIEATIAELREAYLPGRRGIELRELAGGFTFASAPDTDDAARKLLSTPRTPPLSPAQAETLAIVAYLQPVSRPEIGRIRGVSPDSATATLVERGLIEESGRSEFGATLYRTTTLFLKLFGLAALDDLPDIAEWDPTPEDVTELRERLGKVGDARSGGGQVEAESAPAAEGEPEPGAEGPITVTAASNPPVA